MLTKKERAELREYVKDIQNEMSVSGNVASYSTPRAFNKNKDAEGSEASEEADPSTAYFEKPPKRGTAKSFDVVSLKEGSYKEFKNDPSATPVQKVNKSIAEINRRLAEVNQLLSQSIRLKTESNVASGAYWKKTTRNIAKINERMTVISNKLKKLSE